MKQGAQRLLVPFGVVAGGALLGFLGARYVFVGSGLSLIPWAAAGTGIGIAFRLRSQAIALGAAYGFSLAYTFMIVGYDGAAPLHTRMIPFLTFGVFGALCGAALGLVGNSVRGRVASDSSNQSR